MARHPPLSPDQLPNWPVGNPAEPLAPGVARVWVWSLEPPADEGALLLSFDERERAARFHFEQDRRHFINARAGLRSLLGRVLGVPPADLKFAYQDRGKPVLRDGPGQLTFNLSHSAGVAIAAVALGVELGVDIEAVRPTDCSEAIARRFFSQREYEELSRLPPTQQHEGFFRLWTNKEAVIKLLGAGLSFPLPSFATPMNPEGGAWVDLPADNPLGTTPVWVSALDAGERLQASIACAEELRLECCRFQTAG